MMAVAVIFAISFLAPNNRTFIAFIGGCGFGWFIDELGKFITRDVNYFFQPTIALSTSCSSRCTSCSAASSGATFGPDEAVLNALEALKSAAIGELERAAPRGRRWRCSTRPVPTTRSRSTCATLLADATGLPDRRARTGSSVRDAPSARWYLGLTAAAVVHAASVTWWFVVDRVGRSCVAAVVLAADHSAIRGFEEWAIVVSSGVVGRADHRRRACGSGTTGSRRTAGSSAGSSCRSS